MRHSCCHQGWGFLEWLKRRDIGLWASEWGVGSRELKLLFYNGLNVSGLIQTVNTRGRYLRYQS